MLQNSPLYGFVQSCPGNCFQTVQPGTQPYTLQQRGGALLINFVKLLAVGTTASLVGVGLVNTLIFLRETADPTWAPLNPPQNILATSLFYGLYMSVSSNLRWEAVSGPCFASWISWCQAHASTFAEDREHVPLCRYQIIAGVIEGAQ